MIEQNRLNNSQLLILLLVGGILVAVGSLAFYTSINSSIQEALLSTFKVPIAYLQSFDSQVTIIKELQSISDQNQLLRTNLAQLETKLLDQAELQAQNDWLRSQLNLGIAIPKEANLGKIIRFDYNPVPGYALMSIDSAGAKVGDWIVASGYVIGQVVELKGQLARVKALTAADTDEVVRIGGSSTLGKLRGVSGAGLVIKEVSSTAGIGIGDYIYLNSSAADSVSMYMVGKVLSIEGTAADPLWTVVVDAPLALTDLTYALIIRQ
ncbi:MAG: hypothetical protein JNK26_03345 [Candidatus Doudnabacteria bacterium]|nr:hypothetical protein [Candidatus Doudnabacteria bacterium]